MTRHEVENGARSMTQESFQNYAPKKNSLPLSATLKRQLNVIAQGRTACGASPGAPGWTSDSYAAMVNTQPGLTPLPLSSSNLTRIPERAFMIFIRLAGANSWGRICVSSRIWPNNLRYCVVFSCFSKSPSICFSPICIVEGERKCDQLRHHRFAGSFVNRFLGVAM